MAQTRGLGWRSCESFELPDDVLAKSSTEREKSLVLARGS